MSSNKDTASSDSDGDGYTDLEEFSADSDPRDPASTPQNAGSDDDDSALSCAPTGGRAPGWLALIVVVALCRRRSRRSAQARRAADRARSGP